MALHIVDLKCPGCGAPVDTSMRRCPYCDRPVIISSFTNIADTDAHLLSKYAEEYASDIEKAPDDASLNLGIALCYLKLKQYDSAAEFFEKAMRYDFNNSEIPFYAAVCLFKGKKPFTSSMSAVKKAMGYLNSSISLEPRGIYYYFLSYIKYDFYKRKSLKIKPDYKEELQKAKENNVTHADIDMLFGFLDLKIPDEIKIE